MKLPVATALGRRDRSWPAIFVSAAVHAAVVTWALAVSSQPDLQLEQKPIVAKLVRLGEKKPPELLPRKEAALPAEPAPAPPAPVLATAAPTPPAPRSVPAAKPPPAAKAPPSPAPAPSRGSGTSVASILSGARQSAERQRWGSPDGDVLGDSDEGAEGDRYYALVKRAIQANYSVPATLSDQDRLHLQATVVLYIEPDGRITRWRVREPSGNGQFDAALERTLAVTRRLPPPPEGSREDYRSNGLPITFTARDG